MDQVGARTFFVRITVFLLVLFMFAVSVGAMEPEPRPPSLQRTKVLNTRAYLFDFDMPRGPGTPALAEIPNVSGGNARGGVYYYLFGVVRRVSTSGSPLRWDVSNGMVFCTRQSRPAHLHLGPVLSRYPTNALISGPDDGRDSLDRSKLGQGTDSPTGLPPPNYIGLGPIRAAYMGLDGWQVGDEPIQHGLHTSSNGIPVVHYDVRALDDVRVELYMTVNGKLSRWLFDGEKWTLAKNYSAIINGPFLVCKEGNAIIAEKDAHWCIIEPLDNRNPAIRQIVKRVPGEPLVLVEDLIAGRNYFQQQGKLYDENAAAIWSMPVGLEGIARFKSVVDFVFSRREK